VSAKNVTVVRAKRPYRRPCLHPTAGCVALDYRGRRCGRPHFSEVPITFTWDPVRGIGIGAPAATLCRMHDWCGVNGPVRLEVVGGWMGDAWNPDAKVWTVLTTVYATRDGLTASPHWFAMRQPTRFGQNERVTYDQARAG
jgi:hypothetical protein